MSRVRSWDVEGGGGTLLGSGDPPLFRAPAPFEAERENQCLFLFFDCGQFAWGAGRWGWDWGSSEGQGAEGGGVWGGERSWVTGGQPGITRNHPGRGGARALCALSCGQVISQAWGLTEGRPASPQTLCPQQRQGGWCRCKGTNVSSLLGESPTETPPGEWSHEGNCICSEYRDHGD